MVRLQKRVMVGMEDCLVSLPAFVQVCPVRIK